MITDLFVSLAVALAAGPRPEPAAERVVFEIAESLPVVEEHWPGPGGLVPRDGWSPTLVVHADGRWAGLQRLPEYDRDVNRWLTGRLDAASLARLRAAISSARWASGPRCGASTSWSRRLVRAGSRAVSFTRRPGAGDGCLAAPDATISNLLALAQGLTIAAPHHDAGLLVRHLVRPLPDGRAQPDTLDEVVVRRDGTWRRGDRAGRLTAAEVAELEALVRALEPAGGPVRGVVSACTTLADALHTLDLGALGAWHWETAGASLDDAARCRPASASLTRLVARVAALGRG